MELEKVLNNLGLNEKEAKVYLALLQMGTASVQAVARKAETKRPTTYLILEDIRKIGLATLLSRKDKVVYSAESPEKLLIEQERKQEIIKNSIPELLAIYNTKKEKPRVKFYQGKKEILELYENIFKEKNVDLYGSIGTIEDKLPEVIALSAILIKKHKTNIRELLQADEKSIKYTKGKFSAFHRVKLLKKNQLLPTDNVIFGNKLAIFSYKDEPMAVIIEDSAVVATYRTIFEIAWESV